MQEMAALPDAEGRVTRPPHGLRRRRTGGDLLAEKFLPDGEPGNGGGHGGLPFAGGE